LVKLSKLRLLVALTLTMVAKQGVVGLVRAHYLGLLAMSTVAAAAAIVAVLLIAGSA
jgi:hypothetical protein